MRWSGTASTTASPSATWRCGTVVDREQLLSFFQVLSACRFDVALSLPPTSPRACRSPRRSAQSTQPSTESNFHGLSVLHRGRPELLAAVPGYRRLQL